MQFWQERTMRTSLGIKWQGGRADNRRINNSALDEKQRKLMQFIRDLIIIDNKGNNKEKKMEEINKLGAAQKAEKQLISKKKKRKLAARKVFD